MDPLFPKEIQVEFGWSALLELAEQGAENCCVGRGDTQHEIWALGGSQTSAVGTARPTWALEPLFGTSANGAAPFLQT